MGNFWSRLFILFCLLSFLFSLLEWIAFENDFFYDYPRAAFWTTSFVLLLGPSLYFFTKSSLNTNFRFKLSFLIHYIPFTILLGITQLNFQQLSQEQKVIIVENAFLSPSVYVVWTSLAILLGIGLYIFFAFKEIVKYEVVLNNEFANTNHRNIGWLRQLLLAFLVLLTLSFIQNIIKFYSISIWNASLFFSLLTLVFIGSLVLFKFTNYRPLANDIGLNKVTLKINEDEKRELLPVAKKLKTSMMGYKYFLDSEITLKSLSDSMGISSKKISRTINHIEGKNFFDYINEQRIAHACNLLKTLPKSQLNITQVMYESGFNSKSSFNTAFKKYRGETPSEFRKKHLH